MSERRGIKGLELWCRRVTEGYPGVKIENMTTAWRDGLAFCAIIHHFRPELIDFSKLNKDDIYYNNELAFTVAEKYLGIPALLEPEDMVEYTVPDRLSILTYLSQFYRVFVGSQGSPSRIVPKRPTSSAERGLVSPESTSPPTKVAIKSVGTPHRDPCAKCSLPVFIAERLNVGKLLYHRTCFRCARCNSQLTLANYYETETKNQFCCETCPDEETVKQSDRPEPEAPESMIVRSLSDEEKSKVGLKKFTDEDDYSAQFEFALEDANLSKTSSLSSVQNSEFLSARSHFINSQIENFDSDGETPPELPKSQPPDITEKKSHLERSENDIIPNYLNKPYAVHNPNSQYVKDLQSTQPVDVNVNNSDSISVSNQLEAARLKLGKNKEIITKEEPPASEKSPSLVKSRMRLFEEEAKDSKIKEKTSPPPPQKSKNSFESFTTKNNNNTVKSPLSNKNTDDKVGRKGSVSSPNFFGEKQKLTGNKTVSSESQRNEEKGKRTVELRKPSEKPLGTYVFKPKNTNSKTVTAETANGSTRVSPRQKNTNLQSDVIAEGETKKSGVSALKNLFENSLDVPHDHRTLNSPKVDVDESEAREMGTDLPNFSETSGAPVDETVPTAQKLEDEPLDVDDANELNDYVVVNNSAEELTPPLQTVRTTELNAKELAGELTRDSDVPSQSEDSKEFVDLSKVSDDINDVLLHSEKKEEAKEENISHSDSLNAIISSDSSSDDVPDEVIEISDSVIEISDSSADVSPLKSQISSSTVEKSDKGDYPENLNPFSDDEDAEDDGKLQNNSSAKSLNPFDEEDDEEEEEDMERPIETHPAHAKRIIKADKVTFDSPDIPEPLRKLYIQRISESNFPNAATSLNFSEEDRVQQEIPTPKKRTKIKIESPHTADTSESKRIGENPFENDAVSDASSSNLFEEDQEMRIPTPKKRTKIKSPHADTPEFKRIGENPFENDDDDDGEGETAQTEPRKLKMIHAPKISLNPFWSDDDDDGDSDAEHKNEDVLAKSNESRNAGKSPEPVPRKSNQSTVSSSTSLSSASSAAQKKKSPAPKPPPPSFTLDKAESPHSSLASSPATSVQHSPRSTPKARKTKKAPLPPTSTPFLTASNIDDKPPLEISPVIIVTTDGNSDSVSVLNSAKTKEWENEKNVKDEVNRNRQSQCFSPGDSLPPDAHYLSYPANKSTYGKWKRKKGPAPSRPIPQRRTIKSLPVAEIRGELDLIELQQQGLEKQGVRLEQIIRDRCEGPDSIQEDTVPIDVEDLILQLFEVVNEKNEICRRQAELMYLQRQQRLEEEHADVEYQIRCLILEPEANKTDSDKAREEELINRLVEIVERRNEIIECLEMDRIREAEEDDSISNSMNSYASKRDEAKVRSEGEELHKKTKKKFKKEKKTKVKDVQLDVDKDIDESETSNTLSKKEKKKKKFAIF